MAFVQDNEPQEPKTCDTPEQKDFCLKLRNLISIKTNELQRSSAITEQASALVGNFAGTAEVFRYTELLTDRMVSEITRESNDSSPNSFGAAPGSLSISADIEMPGLNGLRVGEFFWIDRIPAFYRAFGAFQIMTIEDIIDTSGWRTKIHARFYYLGREWRQTVLDLFKSVSGSEEGTE